MPNHIHVLLRTPEPNLSSGMQHWLCARANWYSKTQSATRTPVPGTVQVILGRRRQLRRVSLDGGRARDSGAAVPTLHERPTRPAFRPLRSASPRQFRQPGATSKETRRGVCILPPPNLRSRIATGNENRQTKSDPGDSPPGCRNVFTCSSVPISLCLCAT